MVMFRAQGICASRAGRFAQIWTPVRVGDSPTRAAGCGLVSFPGGLRGNRETGGEFESRRVVRHRCQPNKRIGANRHQPPCLAHVPEDLNP